MGLGNVFQTGRTGMMAAKAAISTTGHNIANANTDGYSRQRVLTETNPNLATQGSKAVVGSGTQVSRIERINDEYLEKQVRNAGKDLSHMEEKEMSLKQVEDIFNEMGGEGLNRLVARFFNEFRQLSNEPSNEAVRQSVRESSQAMVNDFKRLRREVEDVRRHVDSRIEGYTREVNAVAEDIRDLNQRIAIAELGGASANDLQDKRDEALKKLGSFMDLAMHKDNHGNFTVDIKGVGPLVVGPQTEKFSVFRTPADDEGKPENALDIHSSSSASAVVTHRLQGGKLGALLEVRDKTISTIIEKLDDLAHSLTQSVNEIHRQGYSREGVQGMNFFKPLVGKQFASEVLDLSEEVKANVNNIAAAALPDAPGDNRVAIAISGLQNQLFMNNGKATFDDWYNSIVSDVGIVANRNRSALNQQRDIVTQLGKMRDQISGVSIDEETANLMQFQHVFDASAKVIQVADEMLGTILELRR
jgi:flagellar hook-associated protein 1 FlgK